MEVGLKTRSPTASRSFRKSTTTSRKACGWDGRQGGPPTYTQTHVRAPKHKTHTHANLASVSYRPTPKHTFMRLNIKYMYARKPLSATRMVSLSFRAAVRPWPPRRTVAHRRVVDCESFFLTLNNPHEAAQRPRVSKHAPVPFFRPIYKLHALDGGVGFLPVSATGECGGGGTATVSLKAVTSIDIALLDAARSTVRRAAAAAAAVYSTIAFSNACTAVTAVAPVALIRGLCRGWGGVCDEGTVGEQKPSKGLGGNDRVLARQADDHGAPDVIRPHDVLEFRN